MSYIGTNPATNFETVQKQISTSNSGTTITLDRAVTSVQDILLTIDAVVQSYDNYSVSGTTLTVGGTLSNNRVEILYVGRTMQSVDPTDDSVSAAKIKTDAVTTAKVQNDAITVDKLNLISTSSVPSLEAKGDGSSQDGYIQLNCSQNSHGVKIKSPPHSAGQSYTLTLPSSITNDYFLKTDGSGNLSFAEAGGGSWTLLSTTNVSDGTSTVNMTLTGSYTIYAVAFNNLIPNNDNNTLRHAFSDDNFSSVNQQIYGGFGIHGVTKSAFFTNDNFQQATGYVRIADNVGGNNTYEGVRGIVYYANMRTAAPKGMYWGNIEGYNYDEKASNHTLTGWMDSTNVCTGIAYNYDSGTFKSGQIKLYGLE